MSEYHGATWKSVENIEWQYAEYSVQSSYSVYEAQVLHKSRMNEFGVQNIYRNFGWL